MSVRILTIGDPHFKVNYIPEVDLFIKSITNLATKLQPDLIIILGDLLDKHEKIYTIPLNKAYELVDNMRKVAKTYVLVGNHDLISCSQFLSSNHWMNGMKEWDNTVVVDKIIYEKIKDMEFIFCPYVYPGRFIEALNTGKKDWKKVNAIFAHQEFFGCKMGAIISVAGDKWDKNYPQIISGHIHSRQIPQKNIYYPGSAMQCAFGESKKNIIAHLTFENNEFKLEEIDLELPRKKIIYVNINDIEEYKIPETKDKIKITLNGNFSEFKTFKKTKKYKKLLEQGIKVNFKPKKLEKKDNIINKHNETHFKDILRTLIKQSKDSYLYQAYELVINNKKIKGDDIIFL